MTENGKIKRNQRFDAVLKEFSLDDSRKTIVLEGLSAEDRRDIHVLSSHYGLCHQSSGSKKNRVLKLSKEEPIQEVNQVPQPLLARAIVKNHEMILNFLKEARESLKSGMQREKLGLSRRRHTCRFKNVCLSTSIPRSTPLYSHGEASRVLNFRKSLPAFQSYPGIKKSLRNYPIDNRKVSY